ncbi:MAG: class I SAM-dependent methyltransferase [Planctomycetota bacterium]
MKPTTLGKKYDKIANLWQEEHGDSDYGVAQIKNALRFRDGKGSSLDVGCGAGGRIARLLLENGYRICGLDVSFEMIKLASKNHPSEQFIHQDICTWDSAEKFDFIVAWDSIFHVPLHEQKSVVSKLCCLLNSDGILIYTFGNAIGEHTDEWHGDTFYYSSIGINENIQLLLDNGLTILHVELDQYPQRHVYVIAKKAS